MPKKKKILSVVSLLTFVQTLASCEPTIINPSTGDSTTTSDTSTSTDSSNSSNETSSPSTSVNNKYRVLFINDNGDRLSLTSSNENGKVVYTGEEPTKKSDGKNVYTFDGWYIQDGDGRIYSSEELPLITQDVVFVAHYYSVGQTYRVRFERDDHTLIEEREFKEGEKAIPSNLTPSKESDVQYDYTFSGWDKEFSKVTQNTTYVANYTQTFRNYTLTFLNGDMSVLGTKTYTYGYYGINAETLGFTPVKDNSVYKEYRFNNVWKNRDTNEILNINTIIRGDCTFIPQFGENIKLYKAEFKFEDGTYINSIGNNGKLTFKYGDTITDISTPVIENTAEYEYQFLGWDKNPNGTTVQSDNVFTAKFQKKKRKYTVKFLSSDGVSTLETKTLEYGSTPTCSKTPTKPSDNDKLYTFTKWQNTETNEVFDSSALPKVIGDVTYKPLFDDETRYYKITFSIDGVVTTKTYRHGVTPTIANPTKDSTAQYTYTFKGWVEGEITSVDSDKTYTAIFEPTTRKYIVTYKDENGSILHTEQVEYNNKPTYSIVPTKQQDESNTYTFVGWKNSSNTIVTPSSINVTGDITYTASFDSKKRQYTITFIDYDGKQLDSKEYNFGEKITNAPTSLTRPSDAEWTYTFIGWDKEVGTVSTNEIFTAKYQQTKRQYTINFVDYDGKQLHSQTLDYGSQVTYAETPTKASTAQYSYTFAGWSPALNTVTGDTTYVAQFTQETRKYTVKYVNYDGTVLQNNILEYGAQVIYSGPTPNRPNSGNYTYTFDGWDLKVSTVTGDLTFTAQYKSNAAGKTVRYRVGDIVVASFTYDPSSSEPTYTGTTPTKASTNEYTYKFSKWVKSSESTDNLTIYDAEFTQSARKYTIQFINYDGSLLKSEQLIWNASVTAPTTPTRVSTAEFEYKFNDWDKQIATTVNGDATYRATYIETKREYTINFIDGDNKIIKTSTFEYGTTPTYTGQTPTKTSTVAIVYTFTNSWYPAIAPVTGNATYVAAFEQSTRQYTVNFVNEDGVILQSSKWGFDATPTYNNSIAPYKNSTKQYNYQWDENDGWDKQITPVKGDITYTAKFTQVLRSYVVRIVRDDGTEIITEDVKYGEKSTYTLTPTKQTTSEFSYVFSKWENDIVPKDTIIYEDTEFVAIFVSMYLTAVQITFLNDDNTVFKKITAKIGDKLFMNDKPTKTNPVTGMVYTFSGWSPVDDAPSFDSIIKGEATYRANFSTEYKKYTVSFTDEQGNKLNNVDSIETSHGTRINLPSALNKPTKPSTAEFEYLTGFWSMNGEKLAEGKKPSDYQITGDTVFMYTFIETKRSYKITFIVEGVSKDGLFEYGSTPVYDGVPFKKTSNDTLYEYEFLGWTPSITTVTGEKTYIATFSELKKKKGKVTFIVDDKSYVSEDIEFGTNIFSLKPNFETDKQSDDPKLYSWVYKGMFVDGLETNQKLTEDTQLLSKEITYIAYWEKQISKYHIVFAKDVESRTPISTSDDKYNQYVTYLETIKAPDFDYSEGDKLGIVTKDSNGWQFAVKPLGSSVYKYQRITSFENLTYDNIKEYQHINSSDVDFLIIPYYDTNNNKYDDTNEYIKLGYYPQTLVTDENLINEFNKVVNGDTTSRAEYDQIHDCYSLKEDPSVRYARRVYDGKEGSAFSISNTNLKTGQSYYFKIELVNWTRRINKFNDNKPLLIANKILDYTTFIEYSKVKTEEDYNKWMNQYDVSETGSTNLAATNYSSSYLRHFLNNEFYNELFKFDFENTVNDSQKNCVAETEISNSIDSTGIKLQGNDYYMHNLDKNFNNYQSTQDKFFALSYQELSAFKNGYYQTSMNNWATRDYQYTNELSNAASKFFTTSSTDYAKFTYFSKYKSASTNKLNEFFLRSPAVQYTSNAFQLRTYQFTYVRGNNIMNHVYTSDIFHSFNGSFPTEKDSQGYALLDYSEQACGVLPAFTPTCAFWSEGSGHKGPWITYK